MHTPTVWLGCPQCVIDVGSLAAGPATIVAMRPIPDELLTGAFTIADARRFGVTPRMLEGHRFTRIFSGVYRCTETKESLRLLLDAACLTLGPSAAASHITSLQLMGLRIGRPFPLHFSTNAQAHLEHPGIVLHRRQGELNTHERHGIPALGPMRTFVDTATQVNDRTLLRIGDWLARHGHVHQLRLLAYVEDSHLNGVVRARRVAPLITARAASPRESDVRWELHRAGLPTPEVNADIHDDHGMWLARGDLVFRAWKVLVEYDGWQHERDPEQRQWDHLRREALEAAGWRVIVITHADMASPATIAIRVRQALRARGCLA